MLEFFNCIPAKDLEKFGEFINSPYFNKSKSMIKFFDYLKKIHPSILNKDISPRKISLIVYSERKINHDKIRKLCSEFMKLFERFLIQKINEGNSMRNKIIVLTPLRLNNLEKRFRRNLVELNKELKKHTPVDYEDYESILRFRTEIIGYYYSVSDESYIKSVNDYLKTADVFYIYTKLNGYNSILNELTEAVKERIIKDPPFQMIKFIFEKNKKLFYMHHPEIVINYYDLLMRLHFEDKYVYQLISYYNMNEKKLRDRFRFLCLLSIEGYLRTKMTFEEKEDLMSDITVLHKTHDTLYMKTDLFRKNVIENSEGLIPHDMFIHAVSNALKLGRTQWARNFISKNIEFVSSNLKLSIYYYTTALVLFFEERYEEALTNLIKVSHRTLYVISRILQLKVYFEKAEYTLAGYQLSALKKFLKRGKNVSVRRKRKTELFIKYYNILLRLVSDDVKKLQMGADELHHKLNNNEEYFYNKIWISKELDKLRMK